MAKRHEEEEALIAHLVLASTKISLKKGPNFFLVLSVCLSEGGGGKETGIVPVFTASPPPPPLRPPPPFPPTKRRRKKNIPTGEEEENKMCVRSSLVLPWVGGGRRGNIPTHTKKVPPSSTHIHCSIISEGEKFATQSTKTLSFFFEKNNMCKKHLKIKL